MSTYFQAAKSTIKHLKAGYVDLKSVITGQPPDYGQEFQTTCEEADKCLDDLPKEIQLPEEIQLPLDEIAAARAQLQNKEILISAFGRHNAGKSTLLNALLHDELLPMNLRNETGIRVKIRHDSKIHKRPCTSCCEEDDFCPELHAEGQQDDAFGITHKSVMVYQELHKANKYAKTPGGQCGPTHYTIVSNVPALADAPQGWKVMMTDNPGFGEAHQEHITQLAETSLKTSTAYLYVVDVGQLQDTVDANSFKLLHAKDQGVFSNKRVVIAVTQFDKTFSLMERDQMSEEDAKRIVCDMIKSSTGVEVSPDLVITVCSQWAFAARKFRHFPDDRKLKQYIRSELWKCPQEQRGQQEDIEKEDPILLANRLEKMSGIRNLEERIRVMTGACAEIWVTAMTKNYGSYLGVAVKGVTKLLDSASKKLQERDTGLKRLTGQYEIINSLRKKLTRNKNADSPVYQALLQKSQEDVEGLKASVTQCTAEFKKKCKDLIQNGEAYGPDDFKKDLDILGEKVTIKLKKASDAMSGFKNTCAAHRVHLEAVGDAFMQIRAKSQKLLGAVEVRVSATDEGVETDITEFFQGRKLAHTDLSEKVTIPELTLSWGQWIVYGVRWTVSWWYGRPKYSYESHEILNDSMEQLHTYVKDAGEKYLQDVEVHIAKHFFKEHQEVVNKNLQAFEGDWQKILKRKEEEEACVEDLKDKVNRLGEYQQYLKKLVSTLEEKSREYCISLQRQFDGASCGGMDWFNELDDIM